jgi:hypothetical protein
VTSLCQTRSPHKPLSSTSAPALVPAILLKLIVAKVDVRIRNTRTASTSPNIPPA